MRIIFTIILLSTALSKDSILLSSTHRNPSRAAEKMALDIYTLNKTVENLTISLREAEKQIYWLRKARIKEKNDNATDWHSKERWYLTQIQNQTVKVEELNKEIESVKADIDELEKEKTRIEISRNRYFNKIDSLENISRQLKTENIYLKNEIKKLHLLLTETEIYYSNNYTSNSLTLKIQVFGDVSVYGEPIPIKIQIKKLTDLKKKDFPLKECNSRNSYYLHDKIKVGSTKEIVFCSENSFQKGGFLGKRYNYFIFTFLDFPDYESLNPNGFYRIINLQN
ncbi:hypothetical protein Emtol_3383 [Emticicia oligotrophica DSM 17448]|uniref:EB1 C-terminal domain-containing protein n=1 Tax=Emticicia oligotrophica (strain DSM 17448 / CIP 109782 / MTCC 6937 / GPTSA100-15) TaxID=929562 RepID=A0ABN4ASK2_EMTOG|nr:hypothetical protein [Emticicia oligotrophica]AFK04512.1 hypothetical protein Emtol_3383 [Emticicia oligotrophica DSM 17448]